MKTKTSFILAILTLLALSIDCHAFAEGTYQIIIKKQQEKQASRWSLLDWMNTKKKMAIMDQWLALNSSVNHFEFSLFGEKIKSEEYDEQNVLVKNDGSAAGLSMYYRIFGIEGSWNEIEKTLHEKNARIGLRIFGKSDQGPNIKVFYGMSAQKDFHVNEKINLQFFGGSSTIYLLPFLGGFVEYRKYAKENFETSNTELASNKLTTGAFIEIYFLRLYASLEKHRLKYTGGANERDREIKTTNLGARLFF